MTSFLERRDHALVRVLLDTGVRVSELCQMTVSGTDLDAEVTTVLGKGSRPRSVYFSSRTASALDRYLRARGGNPHSSSDHLWLSQRGRLTPDGVRSRLELIGREVGIPDLHPHRFRHTWAHDHVLHDMSTTDLKRLAGWKSDAMVSRYGASGADVRAAAAARKAARGDRIELRPCRARGRYVCAPVGTSDSAPTPRAGRRRPGSGGPPLSPC